MKQFFGKKSTGTPSGNLENYLANEHVQAYLLFIYQYDYYVLKAQKYDHNKSMP